MAIIENHFIKVRGDLKSVLDPAKQYYMQINSDGQIGAEEVTIPLNTLQSSILESQQEIGAIETQLITIDDSINTNSSNIATLENDNTTNKSNISSLITSVTNLENVDRIKAYRSTNLTINSTATLIPFDQVITNIGITNATGELTIAKNGSYVGTLDVYVNQNNKPNIWFYIAHIPFATGIETIYRGMGQRIIFSEDGSFTYHLNGTMNLLAGDKIKIYAIRSGGTSAVLETLTTTVGTETLTQYPALVSIYKI